MLAKIDSQKDMKISALKTGTRKRFDLLKLLKNFDNANGDIYMYLALYWTQVV